MERALSWLGGDDTGISSKALCLHMLGRPRSKERWATHPRDPADLGRCLRLLALIPEWKPRVGEMASYGSAWAGLVAEWETIAALMDEEVGIDWSKGREASRTYDAMQKAIANGDGP